MRIIGLFSIVFSITFMSIYQPAQSAQRAQATAKEVVAKVREAVALLSSEGEKGLAAFRKQKPPFVWKDSYVFIADCDRGIILANPLQPAREGKPIAAGPTYAGVTAAERAAAQCKAAFRPGGGWYAYSFAKPGTPDIVRKVSYLLKVPGSGWIAGAGVYDAKTPIEDFEKITESESKR